MNIVKTFAATTLLTLSLGLGMANGASATVIAGGNPTGTYYGSWSNTATSQNFLVQFTLAQKTQIDSIDIFTLDYLATVGTSTTVRLRNDDRGNPVASNLYEIIANVSSITPFAASDVVANVALNPFILSAGTYWIGVSGTDSQLGWSSYRTHEQNQRQLNGSSVFITPDIADLAYRINGEVVSEVPEPGSLALAGIAMAGLMVARRKRRA